MIDRNNTKYEYIRFKDGNEVFAMVSESDVSSKLLLHLPMNIHCKPSGVGPGIVMHLGPMIPFTLDDTISVETDTIQARSSISEQYIDFYDEACTTWLDVRENDKIEVRSQIQEDNHKKGIIKRLIEDKMERDFENIFEDYDEYEDEYLDFPTKKDIIH